MSSDEELAKDLTLVSALTIGIGTMVGAGIFVLPGVAARQAGPVVVVSFIVGGIIAMVNAAAVSELGTAMPKAGGGYYYINRALGPLFGSISGMGDWMGLAFASAFYCIGFGGYLTEVLSGTILALPSIDLVLITLTEVQVGGLLAGAIFIGVNYIGAKETGTVQTVIVSLLLGILTVFAASGLLHFDWGVVFADGFAPTDAGYGAVLPATALVFVSFLGYAKIATVAEELQNPGRNLPIAVIGSVAIVTVIYTVLVGLMVGIVEWNLLDEETPVSQVAEITFANIPVLELIGVGLISIGALLATASSANASILASARINFAMGRDRIVTDWLNEIHPRYATPYRSIALTGGMIIVFILALGQDLEVLATAASVLHLIVYTLMNLALIAFREGDAIDYDPDFRVPFYPFTPIVGAVCSFGLIAFMDPVVILLSLGFIALAVVWYWLYARRHTDVQGLLSQYVLDQSDEMPDVAVSAAEMAAPDAAEPPRILVPLANPETEASLLSLAGALAKPHDAVVHAVHIVQVPDQTPLERPDATDLDAESEALLEAATAQLEDEGVAVETTTIVSHRSYGEIYDAARRLDVDTIVMGWGPDSRWSAGRVEQPMSELFGSLPCDVLLLKDRGFDPSRILLPTAGGPDSVLGAQTAATLQDVADATVTLLHVVDKPDAVEAGESFLAEWAAEHDLEEADRKVVASSSVEATIETVAADHTLVIMGATEQGLLARLVGGGPISGVVETVDCSVVLTERPTSRSLLQRLIGR